MTTNPRDWVEEYAGLPLPNEYAMNAPAPRYRAVCNGCGSRGWPCAEDATDIILHCPACGRVLDILDESAYSHWIEARAAQIAYQRESGRRFTIAEWDAYVAQLKRPDLANKALEADHSTRANAQGDTSEPAFDPINHPRHYTSHPSGVECITITEHFGFNLGNVIKYLWRAEEKGAPLDDLRKAEWYLKREIAKREVR